MSILPRHSGTPRPRAVVSTREQRSQHWRELALMALHDQTPARGIRPSHSLVPLLSDPSTSSAKSVQTLGLSPEPTPAWLVLVVYEPVLVLADRPAATARAATITRGEPRQQPHAHRHQPAESGTARLRVLLLATTTHRAQTLPVHWRRVSKPIPITGLVYCM